MDLIENIDFSHKNVLGQLELINGNMQGSANEIRNISVDYSGKLSLLKENINALKIDTTTEFEKLSESNCSHLKSIEKLMNENYKQTLKNFNDKLTGVEKKIEGNVPIQNQMISELKDYIISSEEDRYENLLSSLKKLLSLFQSDSRNLLQSIENSIKLNHLQGERISETINYNYDAIQEQIEVLSHIQEILNKNSEKKIQK